MKNIILLFLFLVPAFIFAQYPATGNKQRLGWQTTGDGLIWRGVAADTVTKPRTINNAYFQLDTVNGVLRRYIATLGKWQAVSTSLTGYALISYVDSLYATDHDRDSTNEIQTLAFASPLLGISDGNNVDLSPLLTGYVTGSGTNNLIPKWSAITNLTNSDVQDDGTAVSILSSKPFQLGQWTTAGRPAGTSGYMGWNTTFNWLDYYSVSGWFSPMQSALTGGLGTSGVFYYADQNGRATGGTNILYRDPSNGRFSFNNGFVDLAEFTIRGANAANAQLFEVKRNNGSTAFRVDNTASATVEIKAGSDAGSTLTQLGLGGFSNSASTMHVFNNGGSLGAISFGFTASSATRWFEINQFYNAAGTYNLVNVRVPVTLTTTSVSNRTALFSIISPINQPVGYLGTTASLEIKPTLTSITGKYYPLVSVHDYPSGFGTTMPNPSSLLDLTSTTKGFLVSRMTSTQRTSITGPANSLLVFQRNGTHGFYAMDSITNTWKRILWDGDAATTWLKPELENVRSVTINAPTRNLNLRLNNFQLDSIVIRDNGVLSNTEIVNKAFITSGIRATLGNANMVLNGTLRGSHGGFGNFVFNGATLFANSSASNFSNIGGISVSLNGAQNQGLGYNVRTADTVAVAGRNLFLGNNINFNTYDYCIMIGDSLTATANGQVKIGNSLNNSQLLFGQKFIYDYDAYILRLSDYGTGTKEATALSKTQSNYLAAFATDGTVLDLNRDTIAKTEKYYTVTSTSSPQTLSNDFPDNLINQGGTQATFTLNFPASPVDGQLLTITHNNAITTLTLDGNGNTIVGSAVTTGVAGSQRKFKFYTGIGWIKLY